MSAALARLSATLRRRHVLARVEQIAADHGTTLLDVFAMAPETFAPRRRIMIALLGVGMSYATAGGLFGLDAHEARAMRWVRR